jgi:polyisoprenoid-binding protein YceI
MTTKRIVLAGGGTAIAGIVLAAVGFWYFVLRDDAPPPVNLADAVASLTSTATATPAEASATATASATTTETSEAVDAGGGADGDLVGTWTLVADGSSFVGYRVEEELGNIGAQTAVGRTTAVSGTLEYDGSAITGVEIVADLTQLTSDDSRRDGQLGRQGIETDTFPTASFVLTEPIAIDAVPAEGEVVAATAVGELTLHGVTQTVSIPIEGQISGDSLVVVGSIEIQFADYDIDTPTSMLVLSIEDHGTMELQLVFALA